jgi:hypothetical protein
MKMKSMKTTCCTSALARSAQRVPVARHAHILDYMALAWSPKSASHHAEAASGPSGRRQRARGARLALHGPAWREGAHERSGTVRTMPYE